MSSQPRSRPAALGTEIAAKLREALARRQVTQAELGKRVSISTSQISLYLRGRRSMSLDEFSNICAALDLSADEIFSQAFLVTNDQRPDRNQGQPQRMMGEGS
ncbi:MULTISPECIES: helix-turn-helix transcriptional regulator [unclassified Corynebacterium]|uniref:helix-turn-helix transcriptional regulator n=1 Tax=unclassified Corynebacterium TaxID=2624378 RepID=UPI0035264CBD